MKVVVVAHGHPELNAGGAERAAYSLFQQLKAVPGIEAFFVARADADKIGHDGSFGLFRSRRDEMLWSPPPVEPFRWISTARDELRLHIKPWLEYLKPDIVHFHHYAFFGLDAFRLVKQLSRCRIALTLHEYNLICNHNGQMVKTELLRLCHASSYSECSACFPNYSSGKFFLREQLIKDLLQSVDAFVSPSDFLADRYLAWGLPPNKMHVLENLLPQQFVSAPGTRSAPSAEGRLRIGYFGQINRYKGANVLLDAVGHLSDDVADQVEILIFGANLENQQPEFRQAIMDQIEGSAAKVSFMGPYRNEDVPRLLRSVDWMVIPSIWWENSPLVIQEARATGTPILASNIGGMAEKVRDGIDGLHFLAGSAVDLASKIEQIANGEVQVNAPVLDLATQNSASLKGHLRIYNSLLSSDEHDDALVFAT